MRQLIKLTNGFSKKWDNLNYTLALRFAYYNFYRIHKTLRCESAMRAGITKRFGAERFNKLRGKLKMQILLDKGEYINLRPNLLDKEAIQKVKEILASIDSSNFAHAGLEGNILDLKSVIDSYDKETQKHKKNEFDLW